MAYTPTGPGTIKRQVLAITRTKIDLVNCSGPRWVRLYCTTEIYLEIPGGADGSALGTDYETIPASTPILRRIPRNHTAFCLTAAAGAPTCEISILSEEG